MNKIQSNRAEANPFFFFFPQVEEQIERKAKLEKVMELVHKDRVDSALMSLILRRRYKVIRDAARQASTLGVPEIFVESDNDQLGFSKQQFSSRHLNLDTSFQEHFSYTTPPTESPPRSPSNLSPIIDGYGYFGRSSSRESSPTRRRSFSIDDTADEGAFVNRF